MANAFNRIEHLRGAVAAQARQAVAVLSVSPFNEDHALLQHMFRRFGWRVHAAGSLRTAMAFLRERPTAVVICEKDLSDGNWRDVLDELKPLKDAPLLIVTSRLVDESLWAEVLNLGGYDVLMKPLDPAEVLRVVGLASEQWRRTALR